MRYSGWFALLTMLSLELCHAFQISPHNRNIPSIGLSFLYPTVSYLTESTHELKMSINPRDEDLYNYDDEDDDDEDDDDDDDDYDEYIDDSDLGDWRAFRNTLLDSSSGEESSEDIAGGYIGEEITNEAPSTKGDKKRPKSVSKANEELLRSQNKALAKEYTEGIWAHESSLPEVGGLVVRLPLEVEVYRSKEKLSIGKELTELLENNDTGNDNTPFLSSTSKENAETSGEGDSKKSKNPDFSFSPLAFQTLLWYRKAQSLIDGKMAEIAKFADDSGQINPRQLDPKAENLLKLYIDNQETWQEVCLVTDRDLTKGNARAYVLNRPMAFRLTENLGRLLLYGAYSAMDESGVPVSQMNRYTKFLRAFEGSCAVYVGGPDRMEEKAEIIHGIEGLEGAVEISPGTKIYRGGLDAAIEGVLEGRFNPLDFRFFVGCHEYRDGDLDVKVYANKYQPIACARALALKQCIQLPKPLWHEVMELAGGELREISRLELMKRDDIQE